MRGVELAPEIEYAAARTRKPSGIKLRLFFTCWVIFALHLATNTVREIYPALAMADHGSFRVDEYAGLHPDLFETPGRGWHINGNPGASMLGAAPYALLKPIVDKVVERVNQTRAAEGKTEPEGYQSPWPMARAFYREAWRRGLDVKFGIAALITQTLCMAPLSAFAVIAMFVLLRNRTSSPRAALWLALLYGFGTPVFFRTAYLNQNLLVAHCLLFGIAVTWDPLIASSRGRCLLVGVCGGAAVLMDYSGIVVIAALFIYLAVQTRQIRPLALFVAGSLGPILLLWLYQWQSFGNPFFPAQHWMPPVAYSDQGYHGFSGPQPQELLANLWDYRYGLFVSCPLLLLALAAPFVRGTNHLLARREQLFCLFASFGVWLFASSIGYSRLQFNTGIRYLMPAVPLLFLLASAVLVRMSTRLFWLVAFTAVAQAWAMAMYRDVERGFGVLDPILKAVFGGPALPLWTVLSRMGGPLADYFKNGASPLFALVLVAALFYALWSPRLNSQE